MAAFEPWQYVSHWGLNRSNATFLGGLPLATLPATISPLRVPRGYARQAYNPSIVGVAAAVRRGRLRFLRVRRDRSRRLDDSASGFSELLARRQQRTQIGRRLGDWRAQADAGDAARRVARRRWHTAGSRRGPTRSSVRSRRRGPSSTRVSLCTATGYGWSARCRSGSTTQRWLRCTSRFKRVGRATGRRGRWLRAWVPNEELRRLVAPQAHGRRTFFDHGSQLHFQSWLVPNLVFELGQQPTPRCAPRGHPRPPGRARRATASAGLAAAAARLASTNSCAAAASPPRRQSCRLSLNGVLLRVDEWGWLVGVGHLHRGHRDTLMGRPLPRKLAYFGHHYTHFFYALDAAPPFAVRAVSSGASATAR